MYKIIFTLFLMSCVLSTSWANDAKDYNIQYDKELSNFPYPFTVSSYALSSQNQTLNMRYMDTGNPKSNKVIVLLHGKNFSGYYWEKVANDLVKNGYRVIIPDQIGFGKSSKPERYQYSFGQLASNTKKLLDSLNIKHYTLVGHSMGGMLGIQMAYQYASDLEKLILINPIGLEPYLDYVQYKDTDFFYNNELNQTVDKARNYQKKNYYDGKWSDEYEALLTPLKGWLNGPDWKAVAWNNALTYNPIFTEDITPKLNKLTTKTYFIIGTRDRTGPGRGWKKPGVDTKLGQYQDLGKAAHEKTRDSVLFELPGLGHMPHFEDYSRFSKVFFPIIE